MSEPTLHGAHIRRARWNPGGRTFELLVRSPADEVGVLFRYRNVERLEPPLPRLAALVEDPSLVIHQILRREGPAGQEHRLRIGGEEIEIVCGAIERTISPVPGQDYLEAGPRFDILSC